MSLVRSTLLSALLSTLALACSSDEPVPESGLPVRHEFDPARAELGRSFLWDAWPGDGMAPTSALETLYLVWDTGVLLGQDYWDEFERRYGFFTPPGHDLPLGFHHVGNNFSMSCLACHADEGPDGEIIMGVGNRRLDTARLGADARRLAELAGVGVPPLPFDDLQDAPGAIDAVGLGFRLAAGSELAKTYGFQQAPSWWQQRYKDRHFTDGSGHVVNHRTMMATLMVFGWAQDKIESYDDEFLDLQQYVFSLEPPAWPYDAPSGAAASRGEALFDARCAACHGTYHGDSAGFPDRVVATAEIGTDPARVESMSQVEVDAINATWWAEPAPFEDTDGYLAPALIGVWASAPYFHNGSAPDLAGVLDSSARPAVWQLVDPPAYDAERGGYAWEVVDTTEPRAYDTTKPGLSSAGHTYGDDLGADEREDLLAYLKTL